MGKCSKRTVIILLNKNDLTGKCSKIPLTVKLERVFNACCYHNPEQEQSIYTRGVQKVLPIDIQKIRGVFKKFCK